MHQARIEAAERTSVVVDLRDAEAARLELLNEALDPLFAGVPAAVDLFDRGLSRGDTPRLWIDPVAHIAMGRDKRIYRFLYDTRLGRRVLAESHEIAEIVRAVTDYVARRLVERELALAEDSEFSARINRREAQRQTRRRRRRGIVAFVLGFLACLLVLNEFPPAEFANTAVGGALPHNHFAAEAAALSGNMKQVIARRVFAAVGGLCRGRRRAGRRYRPRTVEPHQRMMVIMPVNDQLRTALRQHTAKLHGVDEPPQMPTSGNRRRVMDQHDTK
jgi:hypothetical protein